jgi:hypothetical protein
MRKYLLAVAVLLPLAAQDDASLAVVGRIKGEAFDRSKVMDHLYYLTDVYGPRLTGSPEYEQAAKWAMDRLKSYGLSNVHTEAWGPFGRSWSLKQYSVELTEPRYAQLNAVPLAWSSPAKGPITGELTLATLRIQPNAGLKKIEQALEEYQTKWTGKLRGKIVLMSDPKTPQEQSKPQFRRLADTDLANIAKAPAPVAKITLEEFEKIEWPETPKKCKDSSSLFRWMLN